MQDILAHMLWALNCLVILEAIFQLYPLFKNKPYASRRGCLVGMIKYAATMTVNLFMGNFPMTIWLAIGLIKEAIAYVKLLDLKEGYKV